MGKFARQQVANASDARVLPVIATKFFTIPWTNFLVGNGGYRFVILLTDCVFPSATHLMEGFANGCVIGGGLRLGRKSLLDALRGSLQRLGRERVDLYQVAILPSWTRIQNLNGSTLKIWLCSYCRFTFHFLL